MLGTGVLSLGLSLSHYFYSVPSGLLVSLGGMGWLAVLIRWWVVIGSLVAVVVTVDT